MASSPDFDFRACLLASGLVTAADVDMARSELRAVVPFCDQLPADELNRQWAQRLVDTGKINAWQAKQLLLGRSKFHLGTLATYRVIDEVGQGGMGQVFRAVHTVMGRVVAVKTLPKHKATPETIAAFDREVRAQALLDHPNLVRAYDAGHDGGVHYLVTEFVPGIDLRRLMRQAGKLSMQQAASIISQAAQGLAHAHALGLIHRDVKPGNVLVRDDGVVKLSDLGLVEFSTDTEEGYSPSGKIVGTADYLAPEQITAPQTVSPASDIYALGCTLYYAVTGKVPFPGGTVKDKARAHVKLQPIDPRRLNADLSAEFVEVIWAMMVKDPAQRIARAEDVVERLAPWTSNPAPIVLPPRSATTSRLAVAEPLPAERLEDTDPGAVLEPEPAAAPPAMAIPLATPAAPNAPTAIPTAVPIAPPVQRPAPATAPRTRPGQPPQAMAVAAPPVAVPLQSTRPIAAATEETLPDFEPTPLKRRAPAGGFSPALAGGLAAATLLLLAILIWLIAGG